MDIPESMETKRLYLRCYQAGDGLMYYAAGVRNRDHLAKFESGNVVMGLKDGEHAEAVVGELAAEWKAQICFFIGVFHKRTDEWVGQVYVEPTYRELPEFTIGFVADVNFEGKGYISEAVKRVVQMLFKDMGAHRVTSECNENNIRSIRLLERCGFRKIADGSFHGDFLFGLLRREYVDC